MPPVKVSLSEGSRPGRIYHDSNDGCCCLAAKSSPTLKFKAYRHEDIWRTVGTGAGELMIGAHTLRNRTYSTVCTTSPKQTHQ